MADEVKSMKDHVETLIAKAAEAKDPDHAQRFSQAACNAANAMCALNVAAKSV